MKKILSAVMKSCLVAGILVLLAAPSFGAEPFSKNVQTKPQTVKEAPPAIYFIDLVPTNFTGLPPAGATEDEAAINMFGLGVTVQNKGNLAAGPFKITLTCIGVPGSGKDGKTPSCPMSKNETTCIRPDGLQAGNPGSCFLINPLMNFSWGAGKYRLRANVDSDKAVKESNEMNNVLEAIVEVLPKK